MHPNAVFAAASTRLHADLVIVRLKRAGIAPEKITAIYPQAQKPNSAKCWLAGHAKASLPYGESVSVAGPLRRLLKGRAEGSLLAALKLAGLDAQDSRGFADRLGRGEIVVGVKVDSEEEVAIAWHTLREFEADAITIGLPEPQDATPWAETGRKTLKPSAAPAAALAATA